MSWLARWRRYSSRAGSPQEKPLRSWWRPSGSTTGAVFTASADSLPDPATGESYYLVGLRITKEELDKLGDLVLVPGMPAEVFIATGERTAMSYLIKPLTDGLQRAFRDE